MIKEVFELFVPYEKEAEEVIFYFCYSSQSKYKIPGWAQDDLAQELIIKMNKAMDSYDLNRPFRSFMNTVCKRRLIDIHRGVVSSKDLFLKCEPFELRDDDDDESKLDYEIYGERDGELL